MRAAEAWDRLVEAMEAHPPACRGIALFTDDDLNRADVEACAAVCAECPLFAECDDYARAARPAFGVWAGRVRHGRRNREVA